MRVAMECWRAIAKYIETHYNRIRRRSSLGCLTPAAYRASPLTPLRISPIPGRPSLWRCRSGSLQNIQQERMPCVEFLVEWLARRQSR